MRASRIRGCVLLVAAAAVACATDRRELVSSAEQNVAANANASVATSLGANAPSFDLSSVIRRVHFAYRADGEHFRGGHTTYVVDVEGREIHFAPAKPSTSDAPATVSAPLRLETLGITRGDRSLLSGAKPAIDERGGIAWKHASGIVEHLYNDEAGAEQSWDVPSRPAGSGDLVVRVKASGQSLREATATGLHFQNARGDLGVRYGDIAWVDATGARTPLAARFENGVIEIRVPSSVVDAAAYPAVLDPTLGPEVATDTPVAAVSFEDQNVPVVARSSSGWLVVWQDTRGGNQDIYGARVSGAGAVLDATGIVISSAVGNNSAPAIATDGTDYFVVWTENGSGNDLFGRRIKGSDGTKLDNAPIAVSTTVRDQTNASIAYDGTNYVVAWRDTRNDSDNRDIYYRRVVAATGALLDGTPGSGGIAVTTATGNQDNPNVSCDTTRCLIAWQDERNGNIDIYAARTEIATGAVLDPNGIAVATETSDQTAPSVANDGTSFAVVWTDDRGAALDVYGARITSATGALVDGPAATGGVVISNATNNQQAPSITRIGAQYLVVWQDRRVSNQDVYAARLADNLVPVAADANGVQIIGAAGDQTRPRVAHDGTTALVVWQDRRTGLHNDVVGQRLTVSTMALLDGVVATGGIQIGTADNTQRRPQVASDGTNALVVWQDNRSPAPDIFGVRVSLANGTVLDPNGITITAAAGNQQAPHVTFGGGQYLVVWQDRRGASEDIYGQRVSTAGAPQDGDGFVIVNAANDQSRPRVAYSAGANNYLVAYHTSSDVFARRVSTAAALSDGASTTTGITVSNAANEQSNVAVASNGTDYFVVWQDARNDSRNACGNGNPDCAAAEYCVNNTCRNENVYGARIVGSSGAVTDANGIAISTANNQQSVPAVAFGGGTYFAVWQDRRTGTTDIYGARINPANGNVSEANGLAVSTARLSQNNPAVAWTGTDFLAAWSDQRAGLFDVYAARVSSSGALRDAPAATGGFAVSSEVPPEDFPAVTGTTSGAAFISYQRLSSGGSVRVFGRTVAFAAQGAACTTLSDCATGFCADGVCCNEACGGGKTDDCRACSVAAGAATDGTCATIAAAKAYACRPAQHATCDTAEVCDGTNAACPTDVTTADGTTCGAGGTCTGGACNEPDAGPPILGDSGTIDGAVFVDADVPVGGDAGSNAEAGPTTDGGADDAGAPTSGGEKKEDDGGGCRAAGRPLTNGSNGFAVGGALALALALVSRRKRSKEAR